MSFFASILREFLTGSQLTWPAWSNSQQSLFLLISSRAQLVAPFKCMCYSQALVSQEMKSKRCQDAKSADWAPFWHTGRYTCLTSPQASPAIPIEAQKCIMQ